MHVEPAALHILTYPSATLRQETQAMQTPGPEVQAVADRMIQLMNEAPGIGLAAPQVGLPWRMFVAHVPEDAVDEAHDLDSDDDLIGILPEPTVYINPVLRPIGRAAQWQTEGCLSLPGISGEVFRPRDVEISAMDLAGQSFTQLGTGLVARCWQHECDHLDGVLIIDKMKQADRLRHRAAIRQLEQAHAS